MRGESHPCSHDSVAKVRPVTIVPRRSSQGRSPVSEVAADVELQLGEPHLRLEAAPDAIQGAAHREQPAAGGSVRHDRAGVHEPRGSPGLGLQEIRRRPMLVRMVGELEDIGQRSDPRQVLGQRREHGSDRVGLWFGGLAGGRRGALRLGDRLRGRLADFVDDARHLGDAGADRGSQAAPPGIS